MAADDRKEDWLLARARGIGGSDTAAVVGLSPWKRPIDIFVTKTQQLSFELPTEAMWWGNFLETGVRRRYSELAQVEVSHGQSIVKLFPLAHAHSGQTIVASSEETWRLGTPDGVIPSQRRGLEIKTAGYRSHEWGKVGSDEIPGHYLIQVAWYMAVCELAEWDVAVLFRGNQLEVFRVKRNADLERELIEAARAFWHDHVLKKMEPPIDESESYARYLARKYSFSNDRLMPATDEIEAMALELSAATAAAEAAEAAKQLVKNRIAATLGEHAGCKTAIGKLGWIRPKECDRTDWEKLAMSLEPSPDLIAKFTTKQAKTPYVQAWFAKEK
jgi:putative phage-type endonuclease